MRIDKIRISNILGVEALDFTAGQFTTISGENGAGKTSILEAMKSVFEGGKDATLLRHGQKAGEIVLILDDGTTIKKRVTEKSQDTTVERDGVRQARPQEAIKALTDMFSVNPIDFLLAPKKDRLRVLLESLPMQADADKIREIVGDANLVVTGANALEQIDGAYKSVFADRTGTNRAVREKEASINQLRNTLPAAAEGAPTGNAAELEEQIAETRRECADALAVVDDKLIGYRAKHRVDLDALEVEMEAIRVRVQEAKDWMTSTETKAQARRSQLREHYAQAAAPLETQLAVIRQSAGATARAEQTRAVITQFTGELATLTADAERQTTALDALDAYKIDLMSALPVEGLTVQDGEIMRNGTVFDRLNTAQQVDIAVELAKLRAGELGVICVDGLESLNTEHFDAFKTRALASGLQLFVTRVTDEPFKIETE